MGLFVVLILYLVVLSIVAAVCSAILAAATRWYLRGAPAGRNKLMSYAALLPFICVVYAGLWFVAYAVINDVVFHQDPMLGDGWYSDIGDGYAIEMIDVTDQGTVYPTTGPGAGLNSPEGVSGVRRMQVSGPYIFGTEDKNWFGKFGNHSKDETAFFAIDTRTHAKAEFATEAALAAYASQRRITLSMRPIADVCSGYRKTWFDVVAGLILLTVPTLCLVWLIRRVIGSKRERLAPAQAAS